MGDGGNMLKAVLISAMIGIQTADAAVQVDSDSIGELYTVTGCSLLTSAAVSAIEYTGANGDEVRKITITHLDENDEDATWLRATIRTRSDGTLFIGITEGNSVVNLYTAVTSTSAVVQPLHDDPALSGVPINQHLLAILAEEIGISFTNSHGTALKTAVQALVTC